MRVLLVEDDARTAAFIVKGLDQAGLVVEHVSDGKDGLHMALTNTYDAAVVDVMLPSMDGFTMVREFRNHKLSLPVIILSAKNSVDDRIHGLQEGGDDYLTKPFAFSELLARLQALIRRAQGTTEPTQLMVADLCVDLLSRKVRRGEDEITLQPLEFSLLEYLFRNVGRVVSKTMIMEHVWDYNFDPETNVVEARMCRLRDKIDRPFERKLPGYRLDSSDALYGVFSQRLSYPKNMSDLMTCFFTEEACRTPIEALRWPDGYLCAKCGNQKSWKTKRGLSVCSKCQYQQSPVAGTIFKIPVSRCEFGFRRSGGVQASRMERVLKICKACWG